MVPADDEILAAEYLRYQATIAGVALKEPPAAGVKDTVADWNAANPTHLRGPNGRFIRVGGGLPSAPAAPRADGLDELDDRDLRDLAIEHGLNPGHLGAVDRAQVIADLRTAGAVAPDVTRAAQAAQATPFAIRPELAALRTRAELEAYTAEQVSLRLGRLVPVRLGNRLPLDTARELSEGLLRASERWPNANLARVDVVGSRQLRGSAPDAWSATSVGPAGMQIQFNEAQLGNRRNFLRRLQRTIDAGDHRPTAGSNGAAYVAAHEFGRVVEASLPEPSRHDSARMRAAARHMQNAGVDLNDSSAVQDYFRRHLGGYAVHSTPAAVAEAFADVELNGEGGASPLSVAIVRQMRIDHDALSGGGRHRALAPNMVPGSVLPGSGDPWANQPPSISIRQPRSPATPGEERHIGNLIPLDAAEAATRSREIKRAIKDELEGHDYAGLRVQVASVFAEGNVIEFQVRIRDANGHNVGHSTRRLRRNPDGTLSVYHALLELDGRTQGQGFAEAWNGRLMRWYSESGVDRVTVTANIDVGGYCVPMRARILTRRGWLKRDQIRQDDQTLGYDFATATLQWTPIKAVADFDSLPMLRFEHRNWATECTPNHRWVVQRFAAPNRQATWLAPQFMTADQLAKHGRRIIVSAPADTPDQSDLSADEAALLGWLVTDGNIHRRIRPGRSHPEVTAAIAQEKTTGRQALEKLGSRLGWKMTPRGCNVPAKVLRGLYDKLALPYGDDLKSHLESIVLSMGPGQLQAFCQAGMLAEGDHNRARFWQQPGAVLDAFALAFFMTGHRIAVGVQATKGLGWLSISTPHVTSEKLRITDLGAQPAWCPQTGLGTWVMELDGHIALTGNTWARQGFDFERATDANDIRSRLERHLQIATDPSSRFGYQPQQIAEAADILLRMRSVPFGHPQFPTAYEVSQAGRLPGHTGRDDLWPGKAAMLGSFWHGVKPVPPPPAPAS